MPTGFLARKKKAVSRRRSEAQIELEAIDEKRMHAILQQEPSEARHRPDRQQGLDGHLGYRYDGLADRF